MKKFLLVIFGGTFLSASAQMIPNGDFTTTSGTTYWTTGSGNFAIVNSVNISGGGQLKGEDGGYFGLVQTSSTTYGSMVSDKFAFNTRPVALRFIATYFPAKTGETFGVFIQFTRKNVDSNRIDTIGRWLGAAAPGLVNPWREFTIDLNGYLLPENPDTCIIAIYPNVNSGAAAGTAICIDNIKFSDFQGKITEVDNHFYGKPSIVPNPVNRNAEAKIQYVLNGESNVKIAVYDLMGRKVSQVFEGVESNGQQSHSLSNLGLEAGTYLLKISTGNFEKTEKILVQ